MHFSEKFAEKQVRFVFERLENTWDMQSITHQTYNIRDLNVLKDFLTILPVKFKKLYVDYWIFDSDSEARQKFNEMIATSDVEFSYDHATNADRVFINKHEANVNQHKNSNTQSSNNAPTRPVQVPAAPTSTAPNPPNTIRVS